MTGPESDQWYTLVLGSISLVIPLLVFVYETWRRGTERKCKLARAGNVLLPTPYRLLPSWFGVISGHTLRLDKTRIPGQLEAWADEYGQDFELNIFNQRAIVVIDRDEMQRIMNLRPSKFRRGMRKDKFVWVGKELGFAPSMFHNEGQDWGRSRRIIAPSLHRHNVEGMIPSMVTVAERLLVRWSNLEASGEVVDARDSFGRFAHDLIALAGLGLRTNSVDVKKGEACPTLDGIKQISDTTMKLLFNPLAP